LALPLPPVTLLLAKGPGFPLGGLGPACLTVVPDTAIRAGGSATATGRVAGGGADVGKGHTGTKGVPGLSSSAMAASTRSKGGGSRSRGNHDWQGHRGDLNDIPRGVVIANGRGKSHIVAEFGKRIVHFSPPVEAHAVTNLLLYRSRWVATRA